MFRLLIETRQLPAVELMRAFVLARLRDVIEEIEDGAMVGDIATRDYGRVGSYYMMLEEE